LHPGVRHGALRRRRREWEQPYTLSWRSASADDAEWMSGKSRARLAPVLTGGSSWMSDLGGLGIWICARSREDRSAQVSDHRRARRVTPRALDCPRCYTLSASKSCRTRTSPAPLWWAWGHNQPRRSNGRIHPAEPGYLDLVNANVMIEVDSSSSGVKKMYSRQRTTQSEACTSPIVR